MAPRRFFTSVTRAARRYWPQAKASHKVRVDARFIQILTAMNTRTLSLALALAALVPVTASAAGAGFPEKLVRIVVPYPPGGTADVLGRLLADQLGQQWDQRVVVDNKAGAGGAIGVQAVVSAPPTGHDIVLGVTGALTIAPHLRALPYDPVKDLAPISLVAAAPSMLAVHPSVPANNVAELIALAQAQPGKLSFSSAGVGTSVHIAGELFKSMAGIDVLHVPYKGGTPSVLALLAGEVSMTFENVPVLQPHVQAGKLRGLAVTGTGRAFSVQNLPPMADTLKGYAVTTWFGLFAPAGTPPAVIDKIHAGVVQALASESIRVRLNGLGIESVASSPAELSEHVRAESQRFGRLITEAKIKAE